MEEFHDHTCDETCSREHAQAPLGQASRGWIWVVGIIVVVALALLLLQGNVPDVNAPANQEPATTPTNDEPPTDTGAVPYGDDGLTGTVPYGDDRLDGSGEATFILE